RAWSGAGALRALACATAVGVPGVALAWVWAPGLIWAIAAATVVVLMLQRREPSPTTQPPPRGADASPGFTAGVAGTVTTVVTLGLGSLDAHGAGVVASLPVMAAAVALRQHRLAGGGAARHFLDGYLAGLVGRIAFSGSFGLLVLAMPLPAALLIAALVATAIGLAHSVARRFRPELVRLQAPVPPLWPALARTRTALCAMVLAATMPVPLSWSHSGVETSRTSTATTRAEGTVPTNDP